VDRKAGYFELTMWPHMRAAYNYARWLVRNNHDAEDVVQESFMKAYRALETFRGGDARVWILSIVRNAALDLLRRNKAGDLSVGDDLPEPADTSPDPERTLLDQSRRQHVRQAISRLAPEFRETLVFREIEGLSYKEIAGILKVPMGTVMSRLSRARTMLLSELIAEKEVRL
jgi:RNA polymerase sigma factor (sigma-70 family)